MTQNSFIRTAIMRKVTFDALPFSSDARREQIEDVVFKWILETCGRIICGWWNWSGCEVRCGKKHCKSENSASTYFLPARDKIGCELLPGMSKLINYEAVKEK